MKKFLSTQDQAWALQCKPNQIDWNNFQNAICTQNEECCSSNCGWNATRGTCQPRP